jgi:solute carrier family 35, member F1/2
MWRRALGSVALGQVLSLLLASESVFSQLLVSKFGVSAPAAQSALNYFLLGIVFMPWLAFSHRRKSRAGKKDSGSVQTDLSGGRGCIDWGSFWAVWRARGLLYLPLALVDVEANFLIVTAFRYTNITSVMLLDCFTIPNVMLLSWLFLKARYTARQYAGVVVCLVGLATLVVSDALTESREDGSNPLLGDALTVSATVLYAVSNVGQEHFVKSQSMLEWLAFIGTFGFIISVAQTMALERDQLEGAAAWSPWVFVLICAFSLSLFAVYTTTPHLMRMASATLFNLSVLTSDGLAVLAAYFVFDRPPSVWYFVSLAIISCGLILYSVDGVQAEHQKYTRMVDSVEELSDSGGEDGEREFRDGLGEPEEEDDDGLPG